MTGKPLSRVERLRMELKDAQDKARDARKRNRDHRHIVVGALLLSQPEVFGLDAERLRAVLDRTVTRAHDRAALDLPPLPPE